MQVTNNASSKLKYKVNSNIFRDFPMIKRRLCDFPSPFPNHNFPTHHNRWSSPLKRGKNHWINGFLQMRKSAWKLSFIQAAGKNTEKKNAGKTRKNTVHKITMFSGGKSKRRVLFFPIIFLRFRDRQLFNFHTEKIF